MSDGSIMRILPRLHEDAIGIDDPLAGKTSIQRFLPVVNEDGVITGQVVAVSEQSYQDIKAKLAVLSFENFVHLQALEDEIFYCGVDGGESTGEAIDNLEKVEKELGVYRENAGGPRWQNYQAALDRLCMK